MDSAAKEGHSMPWREVSIMTQRREFVRLAMQEGANRRELCRRFGIHPDTGYKWIGRWAADGELADRSRRPHSSPSRADRNIEERVVAVRDAHPAWGARKIARCLVREGVKPPAISTVHEILRRHGRIVDPPASVAAYQREACTKPALADGFQRLDSAWRWMPLSSVDHSGRPFAL